MTLRSPLGGLRLLLGAALAVIALLAVSYPAMAQMPDPRQMSGIPRPVTDLPDGSVSVRVIRGDMAHNLVGQPVEMHAGDKVTTVNTDAEGRAQFDKLAPGTAVSFSTVVDGEHLESQQFQIQPSGGVRLLLVATDKEAAAAAQAAAIPGQVTIAGDSRIIVEPSDDTVGVYYVLDIVNGAQAPVNPDKPFVFTLPADAINTTVIQGSSPLASNNGRVVTVAGPFPPGITAIQVGAEYPVGNGTVEITQAFPATVQDLIVIAKKEGDMKLASPQFQRQQETVTEGTRVIIGMGPTLASGQPMSLTISGLPHHSSWPRNLALVLAGAILAVGAWLAMRGGDADADRASERKRLIARREKLFQDLVRIEQDRRRNKIDPARYAARREELLQSLEHVYGALDEDDAGPEPAKRTGVAA